MNECPLILFAHFLARNRIDCTLHARSKLFSLPAVVKSGHSTRQQSQLSCGTEHCSCNSVRSKHYANTIELFLQSPVRVLLLAIQFAYLCRLVRFIESALPFICLKIKSFIDVIKYKKNHANLYKISQICSSTTNKTESKTS